MFITKYLYTGATTTTLPRSLMTTIWIPSPNDFNSSRTHL